MRMGHFHPVYLYLCLPSTSCHSQPVGPSHHYRCLEIWSLKTGPCNLERLVATETELGMYANTGDGFKLLCFPWSCSSEYVCVLLAWLVLLHQDCNLKKKKRRRKERKQHMNYSAIIQRKAVLMVEFQILWQIHGTHTLGQRRLIVFLAYSEACCLDANAEW